MNTEQNTAVNAEQDTLDAIWTYIDQMAPRDAKVVRAAARRIRGVLSDARPAEAGAIALALVGAQLAAANTEETK